MGMLVVGILCLLSYSSSSYRVKSSKKHGSIVVSDPELEWNRMEKIISEENNPLGPRGKHWRYSSIPSVNLPDYLRVSANADQKQFFEPAKGARTVPTAVKGIMLATSSPRTTGPPGPKMVELLCHLDRIYARVRKELATASSAYRYLKFGSCPVNQARGSYYYFLYLLTDDCGYAKRGETDYFSVSLVLHFNPEMSPIIRDIPFDVPLDCQYHRFHHSYTPGFHPPGFHPPGFHPGIEGDHSYTPGFHSPGFHPGIEGGTFFKPLRSISTATLITQDVSGSEITASNAYKIGEPMYFEARLSTAMQNAGAVRIYVNKCFMTSSHDSTSTPQYTVIDNHGCMIDSKMTTQSAFLDSTSQKSQRFSIGAFIFYDMYSNPATPKQLYMHCEISAGTSHPTSIAKACNYNPAGRRWKELYNSDPSDTVCDCCDTTCHSATTKASKAMVTSHSWEVDFSSKAFKSDPQLYDPQSFDVDANTGDHEEFLNYWESDY